MTEKFKEIQQKYGLQDDIYLYCHMFCKYLSGDEKVLLAGDFNGYNSLVVNELLNNKENMVTLEPCDIFSNNVKKIRDEHGLNYVIGKEEVCCNGVCNTICKYKQEWKESIRSRIIFNHIDILNFPKTKEPRSQIKCEYQSMSFAEISTKYNIEFDTIFTNGLHFFFLLTDTPESNFLSGINTIFLQGMTSIMPHVQKMIYKKLTESNFEKVESFHDGELIFSRDFTVWRKGIANP